MAKPRDEFERDLVANGLKIVESNSVKKTRVVRMKKNMPFEHKILWVYEILRRHGIKLFRIDELSSEMNICHKTIRKIIEEMVHKGHIK